MDLTKFGHACVRLEKEGRGLVIDPGAMTVEPEALMDVEAVLITHEHFDHFEPDRLRAAAARNPECAAYRCGKRLRTILRDGGPRRYCRGTEAA